jgi:hypothetical protein
MRVVGADDLGGSLDGRPSPASPGDDRGSRIRAEILQLAASTGGDEPDDLHTRQE